MNRIENLSAYVICKDEEKWIDPCIRSLAACGEIIVVDSGSTDGTLDILRTLTQEGYPIRLFERGWPGYAAQKQFALEQCTRQWCLCVDADERLDDELLTALPAYLAREDVDGWKISRSLYIYGFGYTPKLVRKSGLLRLSRNGKAHYNPDHLVHEGLVIKSKVDSIREGMLLHRQALPFGEQMRKEINYASLKAEQLFRAGRKPRYVRMLFNPAVYFFRLYFLNRFFLAGWAGFIHCGKTAIYAFITEAILIEKHKAAEVAEKPDPDDVFRGRPPLRAG